MTYSDKDNLAFYCVRNKTIAHYKFVGAVYCFQHHQRKHQYQISYKIFPGNKINWGRIYSECLPDGTVIYKLYRRSHSGRLRSIPVPQEINTNIFETILFAWSILLENSDLALKEDSLRTDHKTHWTVFTIPTNKAVNPTISDKSKKELD